jgi:hypothetical protein
VFKERLSQSALYHETMRVSEAEARDVFRWLEKAGMHFHFGRDEASDLTRQQVLLQCRMYVATLRLADRVGFAHPVEVDEREAAEVQPGKAGGPR